MSYVRVSLMQPKPGRHAAVQQLVNELTAHFAKQPGFIEGYQLTSGNALVGRVTVWETEASADHAAQDTHVLALRSRLNPDVEGGSHQEHAFEGSRVTPAG